MATLFQTLLMHLALCGLVASLVLLALRSRMARDAFARLCFIWRSLTAFGRFAVCSFLLVGVLVGGDKTNSVNNLPPQMMSPLVQQGNASILTGLAVNGNLINTMNLVQLQATSAERKAANLNVRGAWKDSFWLDFEDGWVFPWGTNHLSGVEVISCGQIWPMPFDTNAVATAGSPFEIVPGLTTFAYEFTPSNSCRFAWTDAAINRDTNDLLTASIELMRCGDVSVTTNGVSWTIPRELPFDHDGFGQDAEWVAANFTNATEIAVAGGYAAWVDAQVGEGLTNGLYKLTVHVDDLPETTQIVIGDTAVAVTNAGDYVFLLGKGIQYPFSASADFATNFTFAVEDDVPSLQALCSPSPLRSGANGDGQWVADTAQVFMPPFCSYFLYEPSLEVVPDGWKPSILSPAKTFTAVLQDVPWFAPSPTYQWSSVGSANVAIASPTQQSTDISCPFPESYGHEVALRLTVLMGGIPLCANYHYSIDSYNTGDCDSCEYDGELPPSLTVESYPSAVFFEKGLVNLDTSDVACRYCVDSSGTFTLSWTGDGCSVKDAANNPVSSGYTWDVDSACAGVRHFTVWNALKSSSPSGTVFAVTFEPDEGNAALEDDASVVFVEYETQTVAQWPLDRSRRTIGVCEDVRIYLSPFVDGSILSQSDPDSLLVKESASNRWKYTAPSHASTDAISASDFGSLFAFNVVEPTGYDSKLVAIDGHGAANGVAGEFEMWLDLTLLPTNVSFAGIQVMEFGVAATNATNYFLEPAHTNLLVHSQIQGANIWIPIGSNNESNDKAGPMELSQPWGVGGEMTWPIPNRFRKTGAAIDKYFCNTDEYFSLTSDGTVRTEKFDWYASVTTNRVFSYGRR